MASSSEVLSAFNADTGLEGRVVSFILVAVGDKVGSDTVSIGVSDVSDEALADNAVECLIGCAGLA